MQKWHIPLKKNQVILENEGKAALKALARNKLQRILIKLFQAIGP